MFLSKLLKFFRSLNRQPGNKFIEDNPETLLSEYLQKFETQYRCLIPNGIKKIIIDYYPRKINYVGKFLKENSKGVKIRSDQLAIIGAGSARLDQPLPTTLEPGNSSIVYRWRAMAIGDGLEQDVVYGVVNPFHLVAITLKDNKFRIHNGDLFPSNDRIWFKGFEPNAIWPPPHSYK